MEYLPGPENTMADALSREEHLRRMTSKDLQHPDVSLALGDVKAGAPHRREDSEGAATCLRGKPSKGEYPGKKS